MRRFAILERFGPQEAEYAVNKIEADSARDALAEYAISKGYADPRADVPEDPHTIAESFFYTTIGTGATVMVIENTELVAQEIT